MSKQCRVKCGGKSKYPFRVPISQSSYYLMVKKTILQQDLVFCRPLWKKSKHLVDPPILSYLLLRKAGLLLVGFPDLCRLKYHRSAGVRSSNRCIKFVSESFRWLFIAMGISWCRLSYSDRCRLLDQLQLNSSRVVCISPEDPEVPVLNKLYTVKTAFLVFQG